ncbi:MAG: Crp/Fnr family transcriptional regulator [Prolixibacteraceae bacterium]|nr:Crp/Fnr family transcriptional regulator [Prolixibacteraceae bacterium]
MNISNDCRECKKSSKCFQLLYPDELEFINSRKTQITYFKGETIFKQGAFAPYVLYVAEGLVKVFLQTGSAKHLNIRLAKQGDFLAFSSVFGVNVYKYSALAIKESTICMIDKTALKKLVMKNTGFSVNLTTRNCRNEDRYLQIIQNVSLKHMRGKLASALLYLSSPEFLAENIFQHLTRQDIADFASVTLESAVKFIKEFEKEGVLKLEGKDIKIINYGKLEEIGKKG